MKKLSFLAPLSVIFLAAVPGLSIGELVDKVAIVVNDEIITDREIEHQLAPIYGKYKTIYKGPKLVEKLEEAKQKVAQQMIEDRLFYGEAKKQNIEVDEKELDSKVRDIVRNIGSKESFDKALLEQQLTMKDLKERYRQQLMIRKLIDRKIGGGVTVAPAEIEAYYNKHPDDYRQPERIKLKSILVSVGKYPDPMKALTLAKDISKRLGEGCDFDGLAKIYSDAPGAAEGGLMGYIKRGDLLPEIDNAVFTLKAGQVTGIVQTSLGYHIFKVEEKEPPKALSLSEARRDVEAAVYKEKVDSKINAWIEALKKNAYIAFK
ncbi:MAG: peptidyl-prolyl cis-trans isomerase [Candidatus Omnitrophota bacterium]|nr:peptidyl-prolyl cis-trans isomerase [Candidatus Omnitrophota bacterium]